MSDQPDFFARTKALADKQPHRLRPPEATKEPGVKEPPLYSPPVYSPLSPGWKSGWRLLAERLGYAPTDEGTNPQPPRNP